MATARDARRDIGLARDLAGAVGWAIFLGAGFALGLWLGSLGADVPADDTFLASIGTIVGAATLVVRLVMVVAGRRRGPRDRPAPQRTRIAGTAPYRPRPVEPREEPRGVRTLSGPPPARTQVPPPRPVPSPRPTPTVTPAPTPTAAPAKRPGAKKTAATKPAAKKPAPKQAAKKAAAKKPAAKKAAAKKTAPKKRPNAT